jgi:hypothetical protein
MFFPCSWMAMSDFDDVAPLAALTTTAITLTENSGTNAAMQRRLPDRDLT